MAHAVSPPSGQRFRVTKPLRAVKLHPDADRSIDNEGFLVQIPAGEVVETDGQTRVSGLRNVIWRGEFYALFEEDLLARSTAVLDQAKSA
ncbi:MAG: hypothetical protein M3Z32_07875 [Acidobacteriota bacterium]|nr:hypothetical protein [Acidobacteriota bacterium]